MHESVEQKRQIAIERIRMFVSGAAGAPILVAFSGGKDSQCIYHLAEEAEIEFKAEYSITRFEPPELIRFIRENYPSVTFRRAYSKSLVKEISTRGLPNRFARWCCASKHKRTEGFNHVLIGIRWDESPRRRDTWRMQGQKPDKVNYLCPICDWSEADVWEYLVGRPHCSIYDEGRTRIGCVCCPLATPKQMMADAKRWPKTAEMLKSGARLFADRMKTKGYITNSGKHCPDWCKANDPEAEYWHRWINSGQTSKPAKAVRWDSGECLFAGTGFSESDGQEGDESHA